MSRKTKVVGLALVAMLAFSAIASASAFGATAPRWKVAGAFLGTGTVEKYTGTSTGEIVLKGAGLTLKSTSCKVINSSSSAAEGEIIGTGTGVPGTGKQKLSCTGVSVVGFESVCSAKTSTTTAGTITTNALTGTLVYLESKKTNGAVGVLFKAETGTEFVNVEVSGAECSLAGKYPVTGGIVAKFTTPGETSVTSSELEFPTTKITSYYANGETATATAVSPLKVKANEGSFTGKFKVALVSGKTVGVFPG